MIKYEKIQPTDNTYNPYFAILIKFIIQVKKIICT